MQKTTLNPVHISGIGLHTGKTVNMRILPAGVHEGIVFERIDVGDTPFRIDARFFNVTETTLNTRLGGDIYVSTIEHLMAAFAGLGITNVTVQLDGPEVPIMDGSSHAFVKKLWDAQIVEQGAPASVFKITKEVCVIDDDGAFAKLSPASGFSISFDIDFEGTAIGHQEAAFNMANGKFIRELANCRTFCRKKEADLMLQNGLGLGGSLDNAVVMDGMEILNAEGFRREDEAVRHKMLDALGDLYLIGGFIEGHYEGHRAGHRLTNLLLKKLFAENAVQKTAARPDVIEKLPGFNIEQRDFAA